MDDCCKSQSSDATCCSSADVSNAEIMLESPHECACGHDKAEDARAQDGI